MFVVHGSHATATEQVSLTEAGFRERAHLQEWVIAHPEVLGDDLLIVTAEYDRWEGANGVTARDRLDVLALEATGRLVIAELKRDEDRRIHIQAITYAALVSTFTPESLARVYAEFLNRRGDLASVEEARARLDEHVVEGWDPDLLRRPRIVLVAAAFARTVTHVAVWLSELGVDISLVQVSAWRLGTELAVGFDVIYPTPEVSDFTLAPARAEARAVTERARERGRAASTASILERAGVLAEGQPLFLQPTHGVSAAEREEITAWVADDPRRGRAAWHADPARCLRWEADEQIWRPTTLAKHIIHSAVGRPAAVVRGPAWWLTETGDDLVSLAESVAGTSTRGPFDWSSLHRIMPNLPPGRWTTYGDLAKAIGTEAQPVGNHILSCVQCVNGERVLRADGRLATNFRWTEPDRSDDPRRLLEEQGIRFDPNGRADPTQRLSPEELAQLTDNFSEDLSQ